MGQEQDADAAACAAAETAYGCCSLVENDPTDGVFATVCGTSEIVPAGISQFRPSTPRAAEVMRSSCPTAAGAGAGAAAEAEAAGAVDLGVRSPHCESSILVGVGRIAVCPGAGLARVRAIGARGPALASWRSRFGRGRRCRWKCLARQSTSVSSPADFVEVTQMGFGPVSVRARAHLQNRVPSQFT